MQRRRLALAGLAVIASAVIAPIAAWATVPTITQLGDPNFFPVAWVNIVQQINSILSAAISDSSYSGFTGVMLAGALISWGGVIFWQYFKGELGPIGLVEPGVIAVFIVLLKQTFATWTFYGYAGCYALGDLIENAMLQTTGLFGPGTFLVKVLGQYQLSSAGNLMSITLPSANMYLIGAVMGFLLNLATYLSVVCPTLLFMLAKLIGPIFIMALPIKRTRFLFDGWFKLYLYACLYGLVARASIVICASLCASLLRTTYAGGVSGMITVIPVENGPAFLMIMALSALSVLFIFAAGAFTAFIVGGSNIGISRALPQIAKYAARLLG